MSDFRMPTALKPIESVASGGTSIQASLDRKARFTHAALVGRRVRLVSDANRDAIAELLQKHHDNGFDEFIHWEVECLNTFVLMCVMNYVDDTP